MMKDTVELHYQKSPTKNQNISASAAMASFINVSLTSHSISWKYNTELLGGGELISIFD